MAESVDATDLKSVDYYCRKGSSPFTPKIFKPFNRPVVFNGDKCVKK